MTQIEELKTLPRGIQTDIALCALVQTLTGKMTKHLQIMAKRGKDTQQFMNEYGEMIREIASVDADVLKALRVLIEP